MLSRREMLALCAASYPAALIQAAAPRKRLGVVSYAFNLRLSSDRGKNGIGDPLAFLEYCHQLGAGGIQTGLGVKDKDYCARLKERAAALSMFVEGQIRLPRDENDVPRFAAEVKTAKEVGVKVLRTVMLGGRRYETFQTAQAFKDWGDGAVRSLGLAAPVMAEYDVRLAPENHKDWRADELIRILEKLNSKHIGVCIDTGNNIALLEDPMDTVTALAPFAFNVHLKDMAVAEYEEGFLLSEVPLGQGFLDLKRIVKVVQQAHPEVEFGLEMITRDPLRVPCLTPKYWATFESLPGKTLAQMMMIVRRQASPKPLPKTTGLTREQQIKLEEDNVRTCLEYARRELSL